MRIVRFLVKASLIFILCQVVLFSLLIVAMQTKAFDNLPLIGGHKPLIVLSGSMEPTLKVGSVVVIGHVNPARINEGDIITFNSPVDLSQPQPQEQTLITHRVNRVIDSNGVRSFETKGDANNDVDARRVSEADVVGRAGIDVPYLGYASHYLRGKTALLFLIAIAAVVIVFEAGRIVLRLRERYYYGSY